MVLCTLVNVERRRRATAGDQRLPPPAQSDERGVCATATRHRSDAAAERHVQGGWIAGAPDVAAGPAQGCVPGQEAR